jgi:hypothetical protein
MQHMAISSFLGRSDRFRKGVRNFDSFKRENAQQAMPRMVDLDNGLWFGEVLNDILLDYFPAALASA